MEEAAIGNGGICGSVALNLRFGAFVAERLGHLEVDEENEASEESKI